MTQPRIIFALELPANWAESAARRLTRHHTPRLMERNPFFAQRPRACMGDQLTIEMALLKLCMRSCLLSGGSLSYGDKLFVYFFSDRIQIARPTEPADPIEIAPDRIEDAVNTFVDAVAAEVTFDPSRFVLYPTADNTGGTTWQHLSQTRVLRALADPRSYPFSDLLIVSESPKSLDDLS